MAADPSSQMSTRDKLIRAAISVVARDGMLAATTAVITETAGVAEGTLYRHFDSKDDLMIAAYRQMKQEIFLNAAAAVDTSLPPLERLRRTWTAIYQAYRADPDAFIFGLRFTESALEAREGGEAARSTLRMVSDLRQAGIDTGDFKNLSADLLANLFLAPINYLLRAEIRGRTWTEEELAAAADSVLAAWRV